MVKIENLFPEPEISNQRQQQTDDDHRGDGDENPAIGIVDVDVAG